MMKMDEEKMDMMDDMMMAMEEAGEGMEGGAVETQRSKARSSAYSRSSSMARRKNALNIS